MLVCLNKSILLFKGTTATTNSDFGLIYRKYNLIIIEVNESDIQAAFIMFLQLSQISQTVNVSLYRVAGLQTGGLVEPLGSGIDPSLGLQRTKIHSSARNY